MSVNNDGYRTRLKSTLESLMVQGKGLLARGNVSFEELQSFKDVGETLLSGTEHSLVGTDTESDTDETTDMELTLEALSDIIDKVGEDAVYSPEHYQAPAVQELMKFRATVEALREYTSYLTAEQEAQIREEQRREAHNTGATSGPSLAWELTTGLLSAVLNGGSGIAASMLSREGDPFEQTLALIDRAIELENRNFLHD